MTTLAELTLEEQRLMDLVASVDDILSSGISARYREVHRQYVALARLGDVEALRRAAFLQWFAVAEPPFLTGLADLDASAKTALIDLLDQSCRNGDVDAQLGWMLPYYTMIADYWFDSTRAPALATFCNTNCPTGSVLLPADLECHERGQLGAYWGSIQRSRLRPGAGEPSDEADEIPPEIDFTWKP